MYQKNINRYKVKLSNQTMIKKFKKNNRSRRLLKDNNTKFKNCPK